MHMGKKKPVLQITFVFCITSSVNVRERHVMSKNELNQEI